ncbi:CDP-diacylglycerol--glycerol-3-phosphate 3-phosphatidyltransferase [Thermosulfuriphilus ammonigenes]|uniref:CDP-diacylglycerol--glycerol-3-phosphate 3-phosphatidyltransferase n=1 Tax=Thermosulfuriphilus ammonigenes TaxID=1936021 RepID=A0A6G7PV51_9BACT|nr:CDP-alcohol phosphatidyltransferase family protein [Thermosulfuriphilus ammonigenes]MBA2848447.1 cardiolipin synthase [Thermosulfuriphilus ammonigenes]QIJ71401.1 CDP-diacylglycerol--glycerol-3-phosphate 3-phosphatidyltransferase [Thermosulfuriphilus ammonigenes]
MNIPNLITLLRILLVPAFVILLLRGYREGALALFIAAGVSDGLDGFLARSLKQQTTLGAVLDPLADKLLLSTSYVTLAIISYLPDWLAVLVISRDVLITLGVVIIFIFRSQVEIRPTLISKATTCLQIATVALALYNGEGVGLKYFIYLTAAATICSGLHYVYKGIRLLSEEN